MALKEFTNGSRISDFMWGGGHTLDTDPTQKGWRSCPTKSGGILAGRSDHQGSFSAVLLPNGDLDVALYEESAQEISRMWKRGLCPDAKYVRMANYPGWGLTAIQELAKWLAN